MAKVIYFGEEPMVALTSAEEERRNNEFLNQINGLNLKIIKAEQEGKAWAEIIKLIKERMEIDANHEKWRRSLVE